MTLGNLMKAQPSFDGTAKLGKNLLNASSFLDSVVNFNA